MEGSNAAVAEQSGIRWLRVVVAGIGAEIALMVVLAPAMLLPDRQRALDIAILPASFLAMAVLGYWAARPLRRRQALHGLLAGAVAGFNPHMPTAWRAH